LVTGALTWLGPLPPVPPVAAGAVAAAAVAVLPRGGWLALATALAVWLAAAQSAGVALLVVAGALPTALLLRRSGPLWSAAALAPGLGMVGLAGAWPALAGQAARPWHRAALGALGGWWVGLAEALTGDRLALGARVPPGPAPAGGWQTDVGRAFTDVLVPLASHGTLALIAVWAVAALVLPVVVRGRLFAPDLVGATAWAAGLGSATQAVAPGMRGLVAGAVAAGGVAVAARASRGKAHSRSAS
ncbi:MAG: eukaryotic-like serine/threonine-protein kinase, partial [Solirubrobacteraceae bacterium]|nr:eukaryotic-like serine/threonine-protein kinase [Solirubrobacteraceae bacterium]